MKKSERAFLMGRLGAVIKDVARTPVECGVKHRALQALDDLAAAVKAGKLKEPPPPPPEAISDDTFDSLKGLRGLSPRGTEGREVLEKAIRRQQYLRRKAKKA